MIPSNEEILKTLRDAGLNVSGVYLKSYSPPSPETSRAVEWETPEGFEITFRRNSLPFWSISYFRCAEIGDSLSRVAQDLVLNIRKSINILQEALL